MFNKIAQELKKLVVFLLILSLITPSFIIDAEPARDTALDNLQWNNNPWDNMPEIEPYSFGYGQMGEFDYSGEELFFEANFFDSTNELDCFIIDEMLREQANAWKHDPRVQESLRFYELTNSPATYSSLSEDDRSLILEHLQIAEGAFNVAHELFFIMERDGFTLAESIDLMTVMTGGLFGYEEARRLIDNIPNAIERNTEIMRFEQFVRTFSIPREITARRLTDRVFAVGDEAAQPTEFANASSFLTPGNFDLRYSFIETAQRKEAELLDIACDDTKEDEPYGGPHVKTIF